MSFTRAASYWGTLSVRYNHRHFEPRYFQRMPASEFTTRLTLHDPGLRVEAGRGWSTANPRWTGFAAGHDVRTPPMRPGYRSDDWHLAIPHWLAMALLLVLPALRLNGFARPAATAGWACAPRAATTSAPVPSDVRNAERPRR